MKERLYKSEGDSNFSNERGNDAIHVNSLSEPSTAGERILQTRSAAQAHGGCKYRQADGTARQSSVVAT